MNAREQLTTIFGLYSTQGLTKERAKAETNLGAMLRTFMAMERWSMRTLAPVIGVSASTLHRVCAGYAMDADTLLKIINWMTRQRK